ncbi:hypothetical protein X566_13980 [Afipia sp. P52-10]|jgi:putative oxidoreductase|uniref:DoxX family protein n=1 Tax=Afipia sp. P52-10 TaxID=1429916 RepID=UPI0003DF24D6|nr:DoxX family protein [Afipia sp. P52-10]ETR78644.1 hypothetical protein X566_13980 [Afipia sp. P52-10]
MNLDRFSAAWSPRVLSVLRIMSALLVLQHGTAKLLGFPIHPQMNNAAMFSMSWNAGVIELIGGALLVIGLFSRASAFILSGMTAFAYFIAHAPKGFYPLLNGGELAALYCFTFLYLACAGGGSWSVDALLKRK